MVVIRYLHVGMYESPHEGLEQMYAKTFCRQRTAMDEVVAIKNASKNHFRDFEKYLQRTALVMNIDVIHNESAYLVQGGPKLSLEFLYSYLRESRGGL